MDEKKLLKLRVLERTQDLIDSVVEKQATPKIVHPNQTNPIYKNLAAFSNVKIGEGKFSVKDLLRW